MSMAATMSRVGLKPARLIALCACLFAAWAVWALDVPPLSGRIVDLAHIIPADVAAALDQELEAHETKTGNQVAVLVLPSLDEEPLEAYSHRVATTWALGQKSRDNGVLLLIALRERKVRIEVGYELEGTLTDLRSSRIIRNTIVPRFRAGDMPGGIADGVRAILHTIEGTGAPPERPHGPAPAPGAFQYVIIGIVVGTLAGLILSHGLAPTRSLLGGVLAYLIAQFGSVFLGIVAAVVTALLLGLFLQGTRGGSRGRYMGWGGPGVTWSGGGFGGGWAGGGGFSGGGGDFGGGGASGDW